jgi:quercetin dioxygenase-like cupin family protein
MGATWRADQTRVNLAFFPRLAAVGFNVIRPDELEWKTRPSEPGEPQRHVAGVTEPAGLEHSRGSLWRYEPSAKGRRHREPVQEETFVVVRGTLTMYLGDPPERHQIGEGSLVHVDAGTAQQSVNETDEELLVYVYGAPPDLDRSEILDSAV